MGALNALFVQIYLTLDAHPIDQSESKANSYYFKKKNFVLNDVKAECQEKHIDKLSALTESYSKCKQYIGCIYAIQIW